MAQTTLTPVISKGLFNADAGKPVLLSGSGQTADLVCDLSGCKDSIIMLVDIPVGGEVKNTIKFVSCEDNKDAEVVLTNGKLNVIRFTTKGIKDADGLGHFQFTTENGMGVDGVTATITLIKCVDVVNH